MTDTPKIMTLRDLLELLSDDAWQKPPEYIDPVVRAAVKANGWIEVTGRTSGQRWHLTPEGFEELTRLRSGEPLAVNRDTFSVLDNVINLEDLALLDDRTEATRWKQVADDRQRKITDLHKSLDEMGRVADELQAKLNAAQTPTELITTGINWYEVVIAPLIEFIVADNPQTTPEYLHSTPAMIAQYVTQIMHQGLLDAIALADERTKIIEKRDGQIESLSRCIEDLNENLKTRMIAPSRAVDALLAVQILDELCDLVPVIEDYRVGRERVVKAVKTLTANR